MEWRELFSHDGLRGKVLLCYVGLLSSIELRHLFYLLLGLSRDTRLSRELGSFQSLFTLTVHHYASLLLQIGSKVILNLLII